MSIQVTESVWPSTQPLDWDLLAQAPFLALRTAPGTDPYGKTKVIELTVAVTAAYQAIYGGRVASAVQIVAIDPVNGRTYVGTPDENGSVPLPAVMHLDPDRPAASPPFPTGNLLYLDLAWQLGLPPEAASYRVFLWLDDLVSRVHEVEIPDAPDRPWQPGRGPGGSPSAVAVSGPAAPPPGPESILLHPGAPTGSRGVLHGAINLAALRALLPTVERPVLTVLALDFLSRRVSFESLVMPLGASGTKAFRVDLNRLLGSTPETDRGKVFVVAHMNGQISPVAVVPAQEPRASQRH